MISNIPQLNIVFGCIMVVLLSYLFATTVTPPVGFFLYAFHALFLFLGASHIILPFTEVLK